MALTAKQEAFAVAYIMNGHDATKAYREIYNVKDGTLDSTVWVSACKLRKVPKVAQRIKSLQMDTYGGDIMEIEERKILLTDLARTGDTRALDMLNKMDGVYVEKKQVEHSGTLTVKSNMAAYYSSVNDNE